MLPRNALTDRLGLTYPIVQAPMASATTPALAASVSEAGALGSLGLGTSTAEVAAAEIQRFRQMTEKPLNANFFCHDSPGDVTGTGHHMRRRLAPFYQDHNAGDVPEPTVPYGTFGPEHAAMLTLEKPAVVSFHFGLPDKDLLQQVRETGAFILCTATTVAEARALETAGVDAIIAQGLEAGGHRGTFLGGDQLNQPGLFALLPQVCRAVSVPVIAAGGIVDGHTAAAAFMLGASAVQVGTAFLRNAESKISEPHRRALASAGDESTRVTRLHSGKPARAIRNRLLDDLADMEGEVAPYPAQRSLVAPLGPKGDGAYQALWAGQNVGLTREMAAADLVRTLAEETAARLKAFA
ncbi:MAG: nitronate monooxygenase [Alphaproteobacteria bacterium]|nr:nitronate monooxygenase [Alphaproteobacteria bacterium]MCB9929405.1 nitronate monooxygenase [Alphaproteobacteria bacterium]